MLILSPANVKSPLSLQFPCSALAAPLLLWSAPAESGDSYRDKTVSCAVCLWETIDKLGRESRFCELHVAYGCHLFNQHLPVCVEHTNTAITAVSSCSKGLPTVWSCYLPLHPLLSETTAWWAATSTFKALPRGFNQSLRCQQGKFRITWWNAVLYFFTWFSFVASTKTFKTGLYHTRAPFTFQFPHGPACHRALCTMQHCYAIHTVHRHKDICWWVLMLSFPVLVANISTFTFRFFLCLGIFYFKDGMQIKTESDTLWHFYVAGNSLTCSAAVGTSCNASKPQHYGLLGLGKARRSCGSCSCLPVHVPS